ncbi:unnamed protein product [Nippostrongylus brasiliensis]|uniref:PDZ domain-containing protein n=1 Tax=Nippostrongylus brasiliensis TaxID=27835 RepID=A0A0N4YIQ6_NIPBR|nr:unnamed protein product [Nippostrongylus brasiliensis]
MSDPFFSQILDLKKVVAHLVNKSQKPNHHNREKDLQTNNYPRKARRSSRVAPLNSRHPPKKVPPSNRNGKPILNNHQFYRQNGRRTSMLDQGSTSSGTLQVLDRICDVNAVPVTDKDVCKNMIIQSLQTYGEVNMIVERPVESYAVEAMERKALTDPSKPRADSNPNAPRLTFQEGPQKSHISLIIGCDRTPSQQAQLKKVPKPSPRPPNK